MARFFTRMKHEGSGGKKEGKDDGCIVVTDLFLWIDFSSIF